MKVETLPENAVLIASPEVWMEGAALDQLAQAARLPDCVRAVGLPDLHPGPGIPVGAAFAFHDHVWPGLIGGDIGCGARVCVVPRARSGGDALERRIRATTEGAAMPDAQPGAVFRAVWARGPRGLAEVPGVPASLAELAEAEPVEEAATSPAPDAPELGESLGTAGGGNHFLELSSVHRIADREAAEALGLTRSSLVVVAHSGSRGLGQLLARRWGDTPLTGEPRASYLRDLEGACRYARANRLVLAWRLLDALGSARPGRIAGAFDVAHNTVEMGRFAGEPAWIHRKGAAPANAGQWTIVLGSRGASSYLLLGLGQESTLCSVAHGAGRRMSRADALSKLRSRYTRASLERTRLGSRVLCDDSELLYAEHPDAYKPVEPILASLEAAGLARPVAELHPLYTVKR